MAPTLSEVLALPALASGRPGVVAGTDRLDVEVRWAHVAEVPEIPTLLRGGELILTTGIGLPRDDAGLAAYVAALAAVPVAALVVELGRAWTGRLPAGMVGAARQCGLPLVELRREVAFVEVTEAVHALVLDAQVAQLRAAQQVHQAFTEMSVDGATPEHVLRQVARMAQTPVVLENLAHQVLAHDAAGADPAQLLARWEARSRQAVVEGRTGWHPDAGLLVTLVGARGQDWGRLLLVRDDPPDPLDVVLLERAAATLALNRLIARDLESLERQTHRSLLAAIASGPAPGPDVLLRARALGVPLEGRRLLGVVVRAGLLPGGQHGALESQARLRDLGEAVAHAARVSGVDALVGPIDDRGIGLLAALQPRHREAEVLAALATEVRRSIRGRLPTVDAERVVVAAGSLVGGARDAGRSLAEAGQVGDAAAHLTTTAPFLRLPDLRLRGLLHLLRDEPRVQTFVERELGPLLAHDSTTGDDLSGTLRAYLAAGRNKSMAAATVHLSRPSLYDRLTRISHLLGADLDDVETCLSLHVALLAHDTSHTPPAP
ncbi:MAG TPA: PucR family transcriptional regulator ligand-binding domain-containing protein [Kineosporiaceae bacterium]